MKRSNNYRHLCPEWNIEIDINDDEIIYCSCSEEAVFKIARQIRMDCIDAQRENPLERKKLKEN